MHHRDYPKYDLVFPILSKEFHSLSFKAMFLRVYSQEPGSLIRIQSLLSAERQFTCGTSSDMLLLIHLKGTKGKQRSLIFACSLTSAH